MDVVIGAHVAPRMGLAVVDREAARRPRIERGNGSAPWSLTAGFTFGGATESTEGVVPSDVSETAGEAVAGREAPRSQAVGRRTNRPAVAAVGPWTRCLGDTVRGRLPVSGCPLRTCTAGTRRRSAAGPRRPSTPRRSPLPRSQTRGHRLRLLRPRERDCPRPHQGPRPGPRRWLYRSLRW